MDPRTNSWRSAALGVVVLAVACSSASQAPLGGPFGGAVANPAAPGFVNSWPATDSGGAADADAEGAADAGAPPGTCLAAAPPATAPTFTQIYTSYFAPGAPVDCAAGSGCHVQFETVKGAWSFLAEYGQVGSAPPGLTDPESSWLSWYGGNMPKTGTACNPQAMAGLNAWAAAGGKDN